RNTVTIAVKGEPQVFVDERFLGIAIIGKQGGQRPKSFGLKALVRNLVSFTMPALISDLIHPVTCLYVDISKVGERSQRPEVLANISDGAFYFPFFPSC